VALGFLTGTGLGLTLLWIPGVTVVRAHGEIAEEEWWSALRSSSAEALLLWIPGALVYILRSLVLGAACW